MGVGPFIGGGFIWGLVLIGLIVLVVGYLIGMYNSLVQKRNRVDNAWAQVQVQLKRRWDLIPNLVETVKGYATHEASTFEAVVAARNAAASVGSASTEQVAKAENALTGALRQLFAVAEAYPDLKANQNFMALQAELSGTEDKISYSRQFFNDTTMMYNVAIEQFPANLIAGAFGFVKRAFFEIDAAESEPVAVKF